MNLIIEKQLKEYIDRDRVVTETLIGSRLYGTNTEKSDTDIVKIYSESVYEFANIGRNNHRFIYTDTKSNTDYIYTSESNFIRNILNGDDVTGVDVLMLNDAFFGEEFNKEIPKLYNVHKCFLGMAKRDLKQGNHKKDKHAWRGAICCESLLKKGFYTKEDIQNANEQDPYRDTIDLKVNRLRECINDMLNDGDLTKTLNPEIIGKLNENLIVSHLKTHEDKIRTREIIDLTNVGLSVDFSNYYKS